MKETFLVIVVLVSIFFIWREVFSGVKKYGFGQTMRRVIRFITVIAPPIGWVIYLVMRKQAGNIHNT